MDLSNYFSLNLKDALKGVAVAVVSSVLTALLTSLESGGLPTGLEWKNIGIVGLTAGVAYIVKNLLTNSEGQLLKSEPKP
jgi:hypothetical protein